MHQGPTVFALISLLLAAAALAFRFDRLVVKKQPFHEDDYLLAGSWVLAAGLTLRSAGMDFRMLTPSRAGSFEILYTAAMWPARIALVLLYQRIFPNQKLKLLLDVTVVATAAIYLPAVVYAVPTLPYTQQGTAARDMTEWTAEYGLKLARKYCSLGSLILTLLLVAIPLEWVLPIKVSHSTSWVKLTFTFVMFFSCIICALVRYLHSANTVRDRHYVGITFRDTRDEIAIWSVFEIFANIVALCLPSRPPVDGQTDPAASARAADLEAFHDSFQGLLRDFQNSDEFKYLTQPWHSFCDAVATRLVSAGYGTAQPTAEKQPDKGDRLEEQDRLKEQATFFSNEKSPVLGVPYAGTDHTESHQEQGHQEHQGQQGQQQ